MKLSTKYGLRVGIGAGLVFGFMQSVQHGATGGIVAGVLFAICFGLTMAFVVRRKERRWEALAAQYGSEGIMHHGPASCALGPGYLILTNLRIVWIPTKERDEHKKIIISRSAIAKTQAGSGLGQQLRIVTTTAESVQFLVTDRKRWLERMHAEPNAEARASLPEARVVG